MGGLLDVTNVLGTGPTYTLAVDDSTGVQIGDHVLAALLGGSAIDGGVYRVSAVPTGNSIDVVDDLEPITTTYGKPAADSAQYYTPTSRGLSQPVDNGPFWAPALRRDNEVIDAQGGVGGTGNYAAGEHEVALWDGIATLSGDAKLKWLDNTHASTPDRFLVNAEAEVNGVAYLDGGTRIDTSTEILNGSRINFTPDADPVNADLYLQRSGARELTVGGVGGTSKLIVDELAVPNLTARSTTDAFIKAESSTTANWAAIDFENTATVKRWRVGVAPITGDFVIRDISLSSDRLYLDVATGALNVPGGWTGDFGLAASSKISWDARTSLDSISDGQLRIANNAGIQGIVLDTTVDGVLSVYEENGSTSASIKVASSEIAAGGQLSWVGRSQISSPTDGAITLINQAGVGFSLLQFGGATGVYPAWKSLSTELQARLADDSNYTNVRVQNLATEGNITATDTGLISWANRTVLQAPSNGDLLVTNAAASQGIRFNTQTADWLDLRTQAGSTSAGLIAANIRVPDAGRIRFGNAPGRGYVGMRADGDLTISDNADTQGITLDTSTAANRLYIYALNGTTLAGVNADNIRLANGSTAAPSYSFTNDTNTGMYSGGADSLEFSVGGVTQLTLGAAVATFTGALDASDWRVDSNVNFSAPAAGILVVSNLAGTDFDELRFGGNTAAFPSLQRSGTDVIIQLADGSANTGITSGSSTISKTLTNSSANDRSSSIEVTLDDSSLAGSEVYEANYVNITRTNTSGWNETWLANWEIDGASRFKIDLEGNVAIFGETNSQIQFGSASGPIFRGLGTSILAAYQSDGLNPGAFQSASYQIFDAANTRGTITFTTPNSIDYTRASITGTTVEGHLAIGVGSSVGRSLILAAPDWISAKNFGHGVQTNPTLYGQSVTDPGLDDTQWWSLTHDQTDCVFTTGAGDIRLAPASNNIKMPDSGGIVWGSGATGARIERVNDLIRIRRADLSNLGTLQVREIDIQNSSVNTAILGFAAGTQATKSRLYGRTIYDSINWGIGSDFGRSLVLCDNTYSAYNFDHGLQTNPTLYGHSAENPDIDPTQWWSLTHDQTDCILGTGSGNLRLSPASGNVVIPDTGAIVWNVGGGGTGLRLERSSSFLRVRNESDTDFATVQAKIFIAQSNSANLGLLYFTGQVADRPLFSCYTVNKQFVFGIGAATNNCFILGDSAYTAVNRDFGHSLQTNPTLFGHSAIDPGVNDKQFWSLTHDQSHTVFGSATGGIEIRPDQNAAQDGQALQIRSATELLTDVSVDATANSLIPAGAVVMGITTRVTTTITGATSFDVGDGSDVDAFGAGIAITSGTTSDTKDWTVGAAPVYASAADVVLTPNGGAFTGGAVRVTVHYFMPIAPTS